MLSHVINFRFVISYEGLFCNVLILATTIIIVPIVHYYWLQTR